MSTNGPSDNSTPIPVGALSPEEQDVLMKRIRQDIRINVRFAIAAFIFFWTILGLLLGIATLILIRKQKRQLALVLDRNNLSVVKVSGQVHRSGSGGKVAIFYAYSVAGYRLPELITDLDAASIDTLGTPLTAEFVPGLKVNRSCYRSDGTGYNLILHKSFDAPTK